MLFALAGCGHSGPNTEELAKRFAADALSGDGAKYIEVTKVEVAPCTPINSTYSCNVDVTFKAKDIGATKLASYVIRVDQEKDGKSNILSAESTSQESLFLAINEANKREFAKKFSAKYFPKK